PRPPRDTTPRPRPSRGKSGKPPAPPREGAAGTPETKHSARGFAEAQAPFLPQIADVAAGVPSPVVPKARTQNVGEGQGESQTLEGGVPPTPSPSPQGGSAHSSRLGNQSTLPALRQSGPLGRSIDDMTASLNALLAKPSERSERAWKVLAQQPMLATHPLVS